jgi:hypothetical protein
MNEGQNLHGELAQFRAKNTKHAHHEKRVLRKKIQNVKKKHQVDYSHSVL